MSGVPLFSYFPIFPEIRVTSHRPDPLLAFSHRVLQIKFIILELAMLLVFLTWVWGKVKHDVLPETPPSQSAPVHR